MTESEKLEIVKALLRKDYSDFDDDVTLATYLHCAKREIINWKYEYKGGAKDIHELPPEYEMIQIHAVVAGYSISGAEGQTEHSENGVSRVWKYEDMVAYIHGHIVPYAGVM